MIKIKLRELMWDKDVSAVDIQRATGIHANTVSGIIRGKRKNIELDTIDKLCKFFDCTLTDLLEFRNG
ncbi:MAG: helix-turn-helix transcriptional regulator [Heliobacteriaceae bacterium]|jgi:putative transcriptional regulator|nr:helix-turn-helix transcriptional regulator [Heliobacteriaceae bacterium]